MDTFTTNLQSTSRMASDERRDQILHIAMRLFSEHGFRGTTTKEIAQAAGVSEAMVFRHYANKNELYRAIIDHKACNQLDIKTPLEKMAELAKAKDDYALFYGLALNALNKHRDDPNFMRLLLYAALEGHELSQMFFENFVVEVYNFLGEYIEQRQREGIFRQMEPRIIVRSFIGMIMHHSLNNTLWDRQQKLLPISNEDAARQFAQILLNGVLTEK
ncbi:MAG TPA: TetR/AcrR family transcriptional regulator [Pyrinomonadaceae bacterium]|nr:TetR/AcrR family transcriptional regulator [Pyrinomonadaceae bacterium]